MATFASSKNIMTTYSLTLLILACLVSSVAAQQQIIETLSQLVQPAMEAFQTATVDCGEDGTLICKAQSVVMYFIQCFMVTGGCVAADADGE